MSEQVGQSGVWPESVSMFVCEVCGRANDIDLYDGRISTNRCRFTGCPSHGDPESKPLKPVRYVLPRASCDPRFCIHPEHRHEDAVGRSVASEGDVLEAVRYALELGADDRSKVALITCLLATVPVADPAHEPVRLVRQAAEDAGAKWVVA